MDEIEQLRAASALQVREAHRVLDLIVPLSVSSTWDAHERRCIVHAMTVFASAQIVQHIDRQVAS